MTCESMGDHEITWKDTGRGERVQSQDYSSILRSNIEGEMNENEVGGTTASIYCV